MTVVPYKRLRLPKCLLVSEYDAVTVTGRTVERHRVMRKKANTFKRQGKVNIPALKTAQMIAVDRLMVSDYGIGLIQMMENAGRSLAELSSRKLGYSLVGRSVCVLCGRGNNGGGGMFAAWHLDNRGANVHVIRLAGKLMEVPTLQWDSLEKIGLRNEPQFDLLQADIIPDALIGYGLIGYLRPEVADWIEKVNATRKTVLALDAPSGLDTTSGTAGRSTIQADATLTLALPKVGLMTEAARPYVGELYLADISVPPELYHQIGLDVENLFERDPIIKIRERI